MSVLVAMQRGDQRADDRAGAGPERCRASGASRGRSAESWSQPTMLRPRSPSPRPSIDDAGIVRPLADRHVARRLLNPPGIVACRVAASGPFR